jgi:hypothetical protein
LQQARKLGFRIPEPSELVARDTQSQQQFPSLSDTAAWSDFTALGGRLPQPPQGKSDDSEYSTDEDDDQGDAEDENDDPSDEISVSATTVIPRAPMLHATPV